MFVTLSKLALGRNLITICAAESEKASACGFEGVSIKTEGIPIAIGVLGCD